MVILDLIVVKARTPALNFGDSQPLVGDAHSASIIFHPTKIGLNGAAYISLAGMHS